MTLEQLLMEYVESPGFTKLSNKSKDAYIHSADLMVSHFKGVDISDIRRSDLIRYMNNNAHRPAAANLAIRVLSVLMSFAVDMDYIPYNPALRLKKLKMGSHLRWEPEEVRAAIALGDRKISTAIALAWYTGQREDDILSMQWKDFKDGYISITQGKTNVEMKIKAHPDLIEYLEKIRHNAPEDHYIVSGKERMGNSAFRRMLKRRTDKLNIDKVFHGIRKGVACSLAENGRPINEIAAIMGHKSIRMAAYYSEQANGTTLRSNAVSGLTTVIGQEPY